MPSSEAIELQEVASKTRYPIDAFLFVQRGLDFTVRRLHGEMDPLEEDLDEFPDDYESSRHVNGQDLCRGLRDFAIKEYGMLARTVLRRWNITACRDFGEIVFAMVDGGLMRKTDNDSIRDFHGVFEFSTAFAPELMLSE
ncbi:MAG: Minf_1886 family protein [Planctomycetota bacterium]